MKRFFYIVLVFLLSGKAVYASKIYDITMDITLDKNGNATIVEKWDADVNEGTEGWHPYSNIGKSEISVLAASMDNIPYTIVSNWKENSSLKEKAYKAGIYLPESDEYDIVFGISKYGRHKYVIKYQITNFVVNLNDADMIYWQLFPYDFSAEPKNVSVTVHGYYSYPDTLEVWGYGKKGAPCYVSNGAIHFESDGSMNSKEYFVLLAKFPKGTFNSYRIDKTFQSYLVMANENAVKYERDNTIQTILGIILIVFFNVIFWFIMIFAVRSANKSKINYEDDYGMKIPKDTPLFRDIPCNKDINRGYAITSAYDFTLKGSFMASNYIGALLLKWLRNGNIVMNGDKNENIEFVMEPENAESYEKDLYGYMKTASKDGILTKNEFKSWCRKNNSTILKWPEKAEKAEIQKLVHNNEAVSKPITKGLIFKYECSGYHFNETVREDALNLYGLKKFLEEFSDMKEKTPIDVKLWDEYLMFAQLFGIASKVMKHFKDFYPEVLQEMELSNFDFNTFYFISNLSSSGVNSAVNYSSGGGGYSFGGGGGGSFGGGIGGGGFR